MIIKLIYVANCEILNVIFIINNCLGYCIQHLYLNAACNRTTLFILQLLLNLICVNESAHTSQVIWYLIIDSLSFFHF